jgi:hypothetical protein
MLRLVSEERELCEDVEVEVGSRERERERERERVE